MVKCKAAIFKQCKSKLLRPCAKQQEYNDQALTKRTDNLDEVEPAVQKGLT